MGKCAAASSPIAAFSGAPPTRLREVGWFVAAEDRNGASRSKRERCFLAGADRGALTRPAERAVVIAQCLAAAIFALGGRRRGVSQWRKVRFAAPPRCVARKGTRS